MKNAKRLLVVSLFLVFPLLAGCWDKGGGEKIGSIIKLNRQGIFCKTWEAEIIRGGINNGSGVMGQSFHFTIEDDSLAKEVEKYMNTQQEVRITYKMELFTWCRSDSDNHFLSKIEPIGMVSIPPVQKEIPKDVPISATSSRDEDLKKIINRQQDILEQNQKIMQQLLEDRKKK